LTDDNKTFCGTENCILLPCQKEWLLNADYTISDDCALFICKKRNLAMKIIFKDSTIRAFEDQWKWLLKSMKPICQECMEQQPTGYSEDSKLQW